MQQQYEGRISEQGAKSPFNPISNNYINSYTTNNNPFPNISQFMPNNNMNNNNNPNSNMNNNINYDLNTNFLNGNMNNNINYYMNNNMYNNNMNDNNIRNNINPNINNNINKLNNPQFNNINPDVQNPFRNPNLRQNDINLINQNILNNSLINNNMSQINNMNNDINYRMIKCGNKFNNNEMNIIIKSSYEEYKRKKDPLSKWIMQRIKNILGGDWVVFICALGLKGYDLSVSIDDDNRLIAFAIDNFKFQIIKIKD